MTNELSTKRAALELIEAEKQRRIDLKMASGEAIWGPPLILVSRVPDKETLPDAENAAVVVERDAAICKIGAGRTAARSTSPAHHISHRRGTPLDLLHSKVAQA